MARLSSSGATARGRIAFTPAFTDCMTHRGSGLSARTITPTPSGSSAAMRSTALANSCPSTSTRTTSAAIWIWKTRSREMPGLVAILNWPVERTISANMLRRDRGAAITRTCNGLWPGPFICQPLSRSRGQGHTRFHSCAAANQFEFNRLACFQHSQDLLQSIIVTHLLAMDLDEEVAQQQTAFIRRTARFHMDHQKRLAGH